LVSAQKGTSVVRRITFQRGRTSAIVSGTLKRGTSHDYLLRANRGQQMIVHLATKADMGFEIMTPSKDVMAEYTQDWTGPLPMSGDYRINVLPPTTTEAPASYTLEVTVR
jgi:hypothetical protein